MRAVPEVVVTLEAAPVVRAVPEVVVALEAAPVVRAVPEVVVALEAVETVAVGSTVVTEVTMAVVAAAWVEILAVVVMAPAVRMARGAAVQASPRHSNGDHGSRLSQTRTATESLPNPDGSKHLLSRKSLGNLLRFLSSQPSTQHLRLIAQGVGVVVARATVAATVVNSAVVLVVDSVGLAGLVRMPR